jgi:hypothetical protein
MTQHSAAPHLINIEHPDSWPGPLLAFLEEHYEVFLGWETNRRASPQYYDHAIRTLEKVLHPYAIRGWHCTRLTDDEIVPLNRMECSYLTR